MSTARLTLSVGEEIPSMLAELAGGEKKMGRYITDLLKSIYAGQKQVGQPGELEICASKEPR